MKPEHRFHSYVTAATVLVMFYFIKHIVPLLTFSPAIDDFLKPAVSLLATVGIYKSLASLVLQTAKRWKWVKRFLLGASYMNGTWIGKFQTSAGETIHTVEHFEQTLSSLKIRGQAFNANGNSYAYWNSVSEIMALRENLWVIFNPSEIEQPVDMWTTSLLPTYPQPCNYLISKNKRAGTAIKYSTIISIRIVRNVLYPQILLRSRNNRRGVRPAQLHLQLRQE